MGKEHLQKNKKQRGESKSVCKIRVLAIERMLNEGRKISTPEILRRLEEQYGIKSSLHTIRNDIRDIETFFPIRADIGRHGGYQKYDVLEDD